MESSSPFDTTDVMGKRAHATYEKARSLFHVNNRKVMSEFTNKEGKISTVDITGVLAAMQAASTDSLLAAYEAGAISQEDSLGLIEASKKGFESYVKESNASCN